MFTVSTLFFVSSAYRIKRKRDNIFSWHTAQAQAMHMANNTHAWGGVQLWRVVWIRMSKVPRVLLEKQVMIGSLSKSLVWQLSRKWWVNHYPKVAKKKNKYGQWPQISIKQTRCSYELERKRIYGVHLCVLSQTSLGGSCLGVAFSFVSISSILGV